MSEWRELALGDVLTLQRGFDITKAEQRPGTVPVVSSSGITSEHDEARADAPGVVVGRKGRLGTAFFLSRPFWPHDTTLWVKDFKGNDPYFCYLALKQLPLAELDAGSSNPTLNRNHAHLLPIAVPGPGTQRGITAIGQAFDELIEINERRIELLEDLARSLYREWFVRFRFPGHEDVDLVDSELGPIPEGWIVRPFSSLAKFLNGFAFKPAHHADVGIPIIKIKELKQGVTSATPRYAGVDLASRYFVEAGDLLFSWSADLGVYNWSNGRGALNQHLFKVSPTEGMTREFLYHSLHQALPDFKARAQGTTMKHIKRSALGEVRCAVPSPDRLHDFTTRIAPIHAEVVTLRQSMFAVAATRDLLLPRLVTGRLDIDDIDLGDLLPAEAA